MEISAIENRSSSSAYYVWIPLVLFLHRHPLGCRFSCLLVDVWEELQGLSRFMSLPVLLDFVLDTTFCGPSKRIRSFFYTNFLLFDCISCTVFFVLGLLVECPQLSICEMIGATSGLS